MLGSLLVFHFFKPYDLEKILFRSKQYPNNEDALKIKVLRGI